MDAPQRLAELARAADEGHLEVVLVHVVLLVGRGEHLALVDVIDAEGLEDLRLDEMPDTALRHHRDRDSVHDPLNDLGITHPRDAARRADVRGNAFERHHRARPRVLCDLGVLGRDDVHDHATLEHLRKAGLQGPCARRTVVFVRLLRAHRNHNRTALTLESRYGRRRRECARTKP